MPRAGLTTYALNRGVVSRLGLARLDVKRLSLAAQQQTNFLPRVLGSMMLRPGWQYLGAMLGNAAARMLRFVFATNDTALLEFTDLALRIWINDALLTRPAVTSAITNGTFAGSLAGWSDNDEAGGVSQWVAGDLMWLEGNGNAFAIREQQVTVAGANIGVEHALRIVIFNGPVVLRVGSASGGDEYVGETELGTGTHSISLTPTGDFYVQFKSQRSYPVQVKSCVVEAAGVVALPTPYATASLGLVRYDQSGDKVYLACANLQQRIVERRGTRPNARSWSVVLYEPEDGPFKLMNTTKTTITPSALAGNVTLTASKGIFSRTQIGALVAIESVGQVVITTGTANGDATNSIRVTGIGGNRQFGIVITGDATLSTVNLQQSYDLVSWVNVAGQQWTADVSTTYSDGLANQIIFYRLILTTRVAPDSVIMAMSIGSGSIRGVARITDYTSATAVFADVLKDFGHTIASTFWQEGQWSDKNGWPTAVRIHEGRMWWLGKNGVQGSVSDAYESFDPTTIGDAGPMNRTIGSGPVDTINWAISLKGLMMGSQGAEHAVRASSLDEVITPTNFNIKAPSNQGSGAVDSVKLDTQAYFVNRSGTKVFGLSFNLQDYDYRADCLMELAPEIGKPGLVRMDAQRLPDTRLHAVRSDGTALVAIMNRTEDVLAWIPVTTDGFVEDVVVLPALDGKQDDQVYYVVRRTVGGATVRYLEKWAQEEDCLGDKAYCFLADAYVHYSGVPTTSITGLGHLEGKSVVVWADGSDVGTLDTARPWTQKYTVVSGQLAPVLATAASEVVVGLGYAAQFQSAKLGLQLQGMSSLNRNKQIAKLGLVLANTHRRGLKYGTNFDETGSRPMDDMPAIERGTTITTEVPTDYEESMVEFPGEWTTDARLCLKAQAPRPATVLAVSVDMEQH